MLMTMAPRCVPKLISSKAPFRVVNEPEAEPNEAVRVTFCEYPAREQQSRIARRCDLLKRRFLHPIY
jgi:hypothetical protein